ncbi:MAG TPA: hypothetical protein VF770_02125, partial [Solirubrobacterales bacterium]
RRCDVFCMPIWSKLGMPAAAAASATAVALAFGGLGGGASYAAPDARAEARDVTVRFLAALQHAQFGRACSLLSPTFYRRNHVRDRSHCVAGFRVGLGPLALRFRILGVTAAGDRARVHAKLDGAPGTVELVRERHGYRVFALQAD